MYESWFTYPITKPYPFRWFTPLTIAGGLILAVLFSFVNLASNGHYLKNIFSENPNATVSSASQWYMKPPFNWDTNFHAKCQENVLSVGDRFFTSNLGLQYEVKSVVRLNDMTALPSVAYLHNPLDDCSLGMSKFILSKADTAKQPNWWMSWTTSSTVATAWCRIATDQGSINVTLDVQNTDDPGIINDNFSLKASTWWGSRLIRNYRWGVPLLMSQIALSRGYLTHGEIRYMRNQSEEDIKSPNFFESDYWFVTSEGKIINTKREEFVSVEAEGLHHARLMQSLVALDLGNCQSPNLLLDETSLQIAIINPDNPSRKLGGDLYLDAANMTDPSRAVNMTDPTDPGKSVYLYQAYDSFAALTGELGCKNATIVTQYLCSVPQRKSAGEILLSVLLANFVFLQASWKLLNLIAEGILARKEKQVKLRRESLQGGYENLRHEEGIGLQSGVGEQSRSVSPLGYESTQNIVLSHDPKSSNLHPGGVLER